MDFDTWMRRVNIHVIAECGLRADDLADKPYWDWWDSGMTPKEAAELLLEEEGWEL